jgi:hypothetical protein
MLSATDRKELSTIDLSRCTPIDSKWSQMREKNCGTAAASGQLELTNKHLLAGPECSL